MSSSSRRRFLGISAGLAGRFAAAGVVSLPMMASLSKRAAAKHHDPVLHCFLRGTRIQTLSGEISVEDLTIGAVVDTFSGPLPVKWIGRQSFKKHSRSWHWSMAPIRVTRFALSDQFPRRDLYLSPSHSLLIDGFLIPIEMLVNGTSIAPAVMDDRDVIDYFHIELETHEVIFAEGAPADTLLVTRNREHFSNFVEYERLYGADEWPAMKPFAPILQYGGARGELERLLRLALSPVVDIRDPIQKARARLATRAELTFV
jgi:hypothetical protein